MNVDAAISHNECIEVRSVVRDCDGQFIRAKCMPVPGAWQPREAEVTGLKEALSWAKENNLHYCIIEIDFYRS